LIAAAAVKRHFTEAISLLFCLSDLVIFTQGAVDSEGYANKSLT
jgi:hypothetical protein